MPDEPGRPRDHTGAGADAGARVVALAQLLHDICATADARSLVPRWGSSASDPGRLDGLDITCPPEAPFRRLAVTAWPAEPYGVVDVVLRDPPWDVAELEVAFGPFQQTPALEGGAGRIVATWDDPELAASAFLQAWIGADGVVDLTIRRDPRPATGRAVGG